MAGIYVLVVESSWGILGLITLAGLLGGIFDSVLGATLQRKGYLSNGMVNFWNTAFGAIGVYVVLGVQ